MTNPFTHMIGWIFKQGMAAVALNEKFKAVDERFTALEARMDDRFKTVDGRFEGVDAKIDHLQEKVELLRIELNGKVEGLRGEMRASIELHERIASLEARVSQESA